MLQRLKARIIGIDLNVEKFAAVKKVENKYSGCYYGELPLSFAASVGNVNICDLLYYCWQKRVEFVVQGTKDEKETQMGAKICKMTRSERNELEKGLSISKLNKSEMQFHLLRSESILSLNSHKILT